MATKKYLELQELSDAELAAELKETQNQFQKMRFDHAIKGLDNPIVLRDIRRDIARLNTEVRKRELSQASEEVVAKRDQIRRRRRKS
ncbi:MAG: 50S ribosomal protein L29 [Saprospiraceae bacterium]|nr:50S ribosomal protein L29 [Saprospiraceae bacterium]